MSRSVRGYEPRCSPVHKAGKDFTAQVQRCKISGCNKPGTVRTTETESVSESPGVPADVIPVDVWFCDEHAKAEARK